MDLFLHVRSIVADDKVGEFNGLMTSFLETRVLEKAPISWKFIAGLKIREEQYPDEMRRRRLLTPKAGETGFINLWRIERDRTGSELAKIMVKLSEMTEYVRLDAAVLHENQEVVYRITGPDLSDDDLVKALRARTRLAFVRNYP